jgi:4-hydroxy-tetrahydrodipicolinate synthase
MNAERVRAALKGVGVTTVTPFASDDLRLDLAALRENLAFLLTNGIGVLYPCGNTGEFHALTRDEWRGVVSETAKIAQGKAVVLACIGYAAETAIEMGRYAVEHGADGVMVMPPMHTYRSSQGLGLYYRRIVETLDVHVVIYKRGEFPSDELLAALVRDDRVVGVKYALNDPNRFANVVARTRGTRAIWTCGTAERWAPFFALAGAQGFTSGIANFAPGLARDMMAALQTGDYSRAMRVRAQVLPFEDLRARHDDANNVPAVKAALDCLGLRAGPPRPPLTPLSAEDRATMLEILSDWGLSRD